MMRMHPVTLHWDSAIQKCFKGDIGKDSEAVVAAGGNSSNIHVDWMIGSGELDIDGITQGGDRVPVMRSGEWAYE